MAEEVSRVAQRCEEAKQSLVLDLSHCELMSLPEAVFFIVKNVQLREVNLSHNKLKKLPKKFSSRFAAVTTLDLSHNSLTTLPDNFNELTQCTSLNLSRNQFTQFPDVLLTMPSMEILDFGHNELTSVDNTKLSQAPALECITLTDNPLSSDCKAILETVVRLKIIL